jgi:hypothetical protein
MSTPPRVAAYLFGRWRRAGSGVTHHRLLKRHVGTREIGDDSEKTGFGHNPSTAAAIAATSSGVGEGVIAIFMKWSGGDASVAPPGAGGSSRSEAETSPDHQNGDQSRSLEGHVAVLAAG